MIKSRHHAAYPFVYFISVMASADLPGWRKVRIINGWYHKEAGGGWEELFDYGGIRYHGRLFPSADGKGIQDQLLLLLTKACEEDDDDMIEDYADECRHLIWSLIEQDYASHSQEEKVDLSLSKGVVKIEGRIVNGEFQAVSHKGRLDYPTKPIPNTFSGVPTFRHALVRRTKQLDNEIFEIAYEGQHYCLKTMHSKQGESGLKREITILQHCRHPHIISFQGVVINDRNNVEGMLTEFIPNPIALDQFDFSHFNREQCDLWISQIRSAVEYLHSNCLVWGDAKPANILIQPPNNDLVLVDFAGGATEEWVDWKKMNTQDGDMQALDRIEQFLRRKVVHSESNN